MITYARGRIRIVDLDGIGTWACECDGEIRAHYRRVFDLGEKFEGSESTGLWQARRSADGALSSSECNFHDGTIGVPDLDAGSSRRHSFDLGPRDFEKRARRLLLRGREIVQIEPLFGGEEGVAFANVRKNTAS